MDLYTIRNLLSDGKKIYDLPLKVTFYARVSTDREDQLNSLDNQVTYFEKFIKNILNWTYVKGYWDEGITGTSVTKRDEFNRMISDAQLNYFDLVITKEVSRFARDTLDSLTHTRQLLNYNVGVYFMSDNINTLEPDSELRLTIMSSIAQEEVRKLSERIKFGHKRSREKGRIAGNNNFRGYNKDKFQKGKLVIDEETEAIVRLIFDLYDKENIGTTKLGHKLYNEYDIKSKTEKPLAGEVITRMLRNPKYKGYFCANKETVIDYRTKKRKRFKMSEWIVYKDSNVPAIVSEDQWDRVNKKLEARSKKHQSENHKDGFSMYPFSGKIICYHDKASYVRGYWSDRKTKEKYYYWGCSNYRKNGKTKKEGCNSPIVYVSEFEMICKSVVKNIISNQDELIKEIYDMVIETKQVSSCEKSRGIYIKKLSALENQKEELIGMKVRKEVNATEYNKYKEKLDEEIENCTRKLSNIKNEVKHQVSSLKDFKRKINNMILEKENILSIAEVLFNKVYVETIANKKMNKKAILHIETNINSYKKSNFSLEAFLLFF